MEIQLIVAVTCLQRTSLGDMRPVAGDVFLFRPGSWHAYEEVEGLSLYNCCFDSTFLARELAWMVDHPMLGSLLWFIPLSPEQHGIAALHLPPREVARCRSILDALRRLARRNPAALFADELGLLLQFLGVLGRHLSPPNSSAKHPSSRTRRSLRRFA